jgi:hypothetical protein
VAIISGIAIVILVLLAIAIHEWDNKKATYTSWIKSGDAGLCKAIQQECARDAAAKPKILPSNQFDMIWVCELAGQSKISRTPPLACNIHNPGSLPAYLVSAAKPALGAIAVLAVLVSLSLYVLLLTLSLYLTETNIGWQRLSIVGAIAVAVVAPSIYLFSAYRINDEEVFLALAICVEGFAATFLAILGGRRVYAWVHGGFSSTASPHDQALPLDASIPVLETAAPSEQNLHDSSANAASPAFASGPEPERILSLPFASPARRYFARWTDLWLLSLPVPFVISLFLSMTNPEFVDWAQRPGSSFAFGWICLPFVMFTEAVIFAVFGNTLGKAIFRISVVTALGEHPTFKEYLRRQLGVYWYGLGTGFPLASIFTVLAQYFNVKQGVQPQYDRNLFSVRARPISMIRIVVNAVLVFGLVVLYGVCLEVLRKM